MARWPTTPSIALMRSFPTLSYYHRRVATVPTSRIRIYLRSERYAHDMLRVLKSGACGWVDWNLLLDYTGGPNHLGNDCDAPIHARRISTASWSSRTWMSFRISRSTSYLVVVEYKRTCEAPSTEAPKSQKLERP